MEKSATIRLTPEEVDAFRLGQEVEKLKAWDLTLQEFNTLINSGQIIIEENE